MNIIKLLIFLSFLLLCAANTWAQAETDSQEHNTIFFRANNSYREEKYAAAVQDYEQLVSSGLRSANVFYNLGNAYLRTGNKGKAILYYERAFRIRPRDADIRANLRFARTLVEDDTEQSSERWYKQAFFFLQGFMSTSEMTFVASVLYFVIMLLVILSVRFKLQRKIFYYAAAVLGFFLIIVMLSLMGGIREYDLQERAVIVASDTDEEMVVRFEPNDDATVHFSLHEGAVIQITRSQGDWHQIKRGDGKTGWLKGDVFVVI